MLGIGVSLIGLAIIAFLIVAVWKVFTKAGQPGWAAIVPFYNFYVMLKIVGRPGWWLALMFIPLANLVILIIVLIDLSKSFGKGGGFATLLILLPFVGYPILGFGEARYFGPAADPNFTPGQPPYYADYLGPQQPYQQPGPIQQGWMQPAYQQPGHHPPQGYPPQPHPQPSHQHPGYPQPQQPGYPQQPSYQQPQQPGYHPAQQQPGYQPQQPPYPPQQPRPGQAPPGYQPPPGYQRPQ